MGLPLVLGCGFLAALPCVVLLVLRLYIRGHPVAPIKNRLDGRVIIITGGSSGIGRAAALECARRGAKVILACRDAAKAEAVVLSIRRKTSNEEVHFRQLDLASLVSVREFVGQFTKQFGRVHTIVNNAGNSVSPLKNHMDGHDMCFQVNYLGHFLLTSLLIKHANPGKSAANLLRVVNLTSDAYKNNKLDFNDLMDRKPGRYGMYETYGRSKLAMVLFTTELNYIYADKGVYAVAVHPGAVSTGLLRNWPGIFGSILRLAAQILFRSPEVGALSIVQCTAVHNPEDYCGKLVFDCAAQEVEEIGKDYRSAERLWYISRDICRLEEETE
ncbi:hypothetical protein CAPTEDRAFT_184420 [Capitella teleta]|uniref:Uncharacterized protein n=1 Tax=Capitella teleta TaxID=283909 RepID=R7UYD0_CAPTE|nr:hypothetical protein CAPTEDRAFT_184420 [Capitella teleta]|eukprot:ELU08436.1 hypothetical protein CAPTEDRAFT_184420 [Capitella teleta]